MLAAALAFYTIFSIAPMLIFMVSITGLIFRHEDARLWMLQQAGAFAGPEVMDALRYMLESIMNPPASIIASSIGLATFFLGVARTVSHLHYSFNYIWKIPPRRRGGVWGTVKGRVMIFLIVITAVLFLILFALASAFLSLAGSYFSGLGPLLHPMLQFVNILISLGLSAVIFTLMFKFLPAEKVAWPVAWIGACVTAFLFFLGKRSIEWYFGSGAIHSMYGAAGSLIVLLLWLFYSAHIIFFGAEFTYVCSRKYGAVITRTGANDQADGRSNL